MISQADATVIGAGALGLSTALHLAGQGVGTVVLLDRFVPGTQTSPRAAGLFKLIQPDETRTRLSSLSIETMLHFEEEMHVQLTTQHQRTPNGSGGSGHMYPGNSVMTPVPQRS